MPPVVTAPAQQNPVTDALLEMLRTVLDPILVGDGEAPQPDAGRSTPAMPYVVLHEIPAEELSGAPLSDAFNSDACWVYQLDGVGANRRQATMALDKARVAVLGRTDHHWTNAVEPDRAAVTRREHHSFSGPIREGGLWSTGERFEIYTTAT